MPRSCIRFVIPGLSLVETRLVVETIESYDFGCMLEKGRMDFGSGSDEQALLSSCHLMPRVVILSSPRVLMMIES